MRRGFSHRWERYESMALSLPREAVDELLAVCVRDGDCGIAECDTSASYGGDAVDVDYV